MRGGILLAFAIYSYFSKDSVFTADKRNAKFKGMTVPSSDVCDILSQGENVGKLCLGQCGVI